MLEVLFPPHSRIELCELIWTFGAEMVLGHFTKRRFKQIMKVLERMPNVT